MYVRKQGLKLQTALTSTLKLTVLSGRVAFSIPLNITDKYSDTSANEDNSFQNHIRLPKSALAET